MSCVIYLCVYRHMYIPQRVSNAVIATIFGLHLLKAKEIRNLPNNYWKLIISGLIYIWKKCMDPHDI